jgi:hypothetical protein
VLVHPHEHVLDHVFPRGPVTENERGQPDELGLVRPERPPRGPPRNATLISCTPHELCPPLVARRWEKFAARHVPDLLVADARSIGEMLKVPTGEHNHRRTDIGNRKSNPDNSVVLVLGRPFLNVLYGLIYGAATSPDQGPSRDRTLVSRNVVSRNYRYVVPGHDPIVEPVSELEPLIIRSLMVRLGGRLVPGADLVEELGVQGGGFVE